MISLEKVSVIFAPDTPLQTRAVADLSLSISEGEFVTVIGSNGAGKSTLLNSISGEVRVSSGSIWIDDVDVTNEPTHLRANRIARVFQDPMAGTCGAFSIEENMALAAQRGKRRGLTASLSQKNRAIFKDKLSALGIGVEERLSDSMELLSGGQRQAVSLLMATLSPSRILLLDEHTAALDPAASELVLSLTDFFVRELRLTTLMVTHSMRHAISYGTRLIMMHQGKIVFDVKGEDKQRLAMKDLLDLFGNLKGGSVESDRMLLV